MTQLIWPLKDFLQKHNMAETEKWNSIFHIHFLHLSSFSSSDKPVSSQNKAANIRPGVVPVWNVSSPILPCLEALGPTTEERFGVYFSQIHQLVGCLNGGLLATASISAGPSHLKRTYLPTHLRLRCTHCSGLQGGKWEPILWENYPFNLAQVRATISSPVKSKPASLRLDPSKNVFALAETVPMHLAKLKTKTHQSRKDRLLLFSPLRTQENTSAAKTGGLGCILFGHLPSVALVFFNQLVFVDIWRQRIGSHGKAQMHRAKITSPRIFYGDFIGFAWVFLSFSNGFSQSCHPANLSDTSLVLGGYCRMHRKCSGFSCTVNAQCLQEKHIHLHYEVITSTFCTKKVLCSTSMKWTLSYLVKHIYTVYTYFYKHVSSSLGL